MPPPASPYAYQTLAQVRAALLLRLNSTGTDFWTNAELNLYIAEALQVWNCLTGTYLQDFTATYDSSSPTWQSLATLTNSTVGANPTSPRLQTLNSNYPFTFIQYMLLEPPTGGTWTGTPQFTINDLSQALQRRRDQILQATANNVLPFSLPVPVGSSRVYLPDTPSQSILDVRRIRIGGSTSTTTLGLALEQDLSNSNQPQVTGFFGLSSTQPTGMLGLVGAGIVFGDFSVVQPDAKLFLTFLNSSMTPLMAIDLSTVGSSVTSPASTAFFLVTANNATVGPTYGFNFSISTESGYAYAVVPNAGNFETDFSSPESDTSINAFPIGTITPASQIAIAGITDPTNAYSVAFYNSSRTLLSSTLATSSSLFTAPANSAYWSMAYNNAVVAPNSGPSVSITLSLATTITIGSGTPTTLYREDGLAYEYFENDFTVSTDPPFAWDVLAGPPLAVTLDTPANVPTILDMLVMISGGLVAPPTASPLLIPDDWNWVLKYGILADILRKESESVDLERADHFEQRFQQGVRLMQELPWLLQARLDNLPVDTPSVAEMDTFAYEWQSDADAQPAIVRGGVDLFAISPPPPAAPSNIAITLSLVANMPIPATDADFVQVPRDTLDAILNYCEYLAKAKEGGFEFAEAQRTLFKNFIQVAVSTNARLMESGIFESTLRPPNSRQDAADPRFATAGAKG